LRIRRMRAGDFEFAAGLSNMENWDNSSEDFKRFPPRKLLFSHSLRS